MSDTFTSILRRVGLTFVLLIFGYAPSVAQSPENGVLREIWTDISDSDIASLLTSSTYPHAPVIQDVLPNFQSPSGIGDKYGTRLRALLTPSQSGNYRFYISGDDESALFISSTASAAGAQEIATVPSHSSSEQWDKFPEQRSDWIALAAGQSYYIEALHKEGSGGDHLAVAWERENGFPLEIIDGQFLAPFAEAPAYDPDKTLYITAGDDFSVYRPALTTQLSGRAHSMNSEGDITVSWTQISGNTVSIANAHSLAPTITFTEEGVFTFQLDVSRGSESQLDQITITVEPALAEGTGAFIQEIWLDIEGVSLDAFKQSPDFPNRPHLTRTTSELSGPKNWGDHYGVRTRGRITPPETGQYIFWVMGNEQTGFFLSADESETHIELLAYTPSATEENDWAEFPEQQSAPVLLQKGSQYYFELHMVEHYGSDYHALAWSYEGGPIQVITGEYGIPVQPITPGSPDIADNPLFVVDAGANQEIHTPDRRALLSGEKLRIRESVTIGSVQWSQISGPSGATFDASNELKTWVSFPSEGLYEFQLSIDASEVTATDTVTVSVLPAINGNTGGFTREVWLGLSGSSVDSLTAHEDFPDRPDIVDQLPTLAGPINWETRYGSRSSGYLVPTRSGPYTFYISADDAAELRISPNTSRNLATRIASSSRVAIGDYRSESQISEPVDLVAGERYYIEALHKQEWGKDHFMVAWSYGDENAPVPIGGGYLEPFDASVEPINTRLQEFAYAGPDRHYYAPTSTVDLSGEIRRIGDQDSFKSVEWTFLGANPDVAIDNPEALFARAHLPGEGAYDFRLTLSANGQTHYDDLRITIRPPLNAATGGLLQAVWLNTEEISLEAALMIQQISMFETDDIATFGFQQILPNTEIPSNWTDYYTTRLAGYLHPPATGSYRFWIAANDSGSLKLSTDRNPANAVLIAETEKAVGPRDWDRYEIQASEPIHLEAGKSYYIDVYHREILRSDNLSIAWSGPGLVGREVITAGYLEPLRPAAAYAKELLALAGEDQTLLWPQDTIQYIGTAFDQNIGPENMSYRWTASDASVQISHPNLPTGQATFPRPGSYTLTLTVTDGLNEVSDSFTVTVQDPLESDAGGITREVWINVGGYHVEDLLESPNYPHDPEIVDTLDSFETPRNWGDYYGQRIRGYLLPPTSGQYQFYIAA